MVNSSLHCRLAALQQEIDDGKLEFEAAGRRLTELVAQLQETNANLLSEVASLKDEVSCAALPIELKIVQTKFIRSVKQSYVDTNSKKLGRNPNLAVRE